MKLPILLLSVSVFALALPLRAGDKTFAKSSASLDVKSVAAKKVTTNSYPTDWGSYDKTFTRSRSLQITVQNFNQTTPFEGQVTLYWLGRRGPSGGPLIAIAKPSVEQVKLAPKGSQSFDADSGLVKASDLNLREIGVRETGGLKLEGWMVVLATPEGVPVAVKASAASIEDDYKRGTLVPIEKPKK